MLVNSKFHYIVSFFLLLIEKNNYSLIKRNVKNIGTVINRFHKSFRPIFNPSKESRLLIHSELISKTNCVHEGFQSLRYCWVVGNLQHYLGLLVWECAYISVQKCDTEIWWKEENQMEKWKEWSELERCDLGAKGTHMPNAKGPKCTWASPFLVSQTHRKL